MPYDHFQTMERIAMLYEPISNFKQDGSTPRPCYFKANGVEDLYDFGDRLSAVKGTILIAIDGCEAESRMNRADGLFYQKHYSVIVAQSCNNERTGTVNAAYQACERHCKQIRNYLLQMPDLRGYLLPDMTVNGIGPIGDNFHGCLLGFDIQEGEDYFIDDGLWQM